MIQIPVNNIYEQHGVINGVSVLEDSVWDNVRLIMSERASNNLHALTTQSPDDSIYLIDRFCQFVYYFQYDKAIGSLVRFMDFSNNMDIALDLYLEMVKKDWKQEDRDKIMNLLSQIQLDANLEKGELIVIKQFPPRTY